MELAGLPVQAVSKLQVSKDKTKSNGVMRKTASVDLWLPHSHIKPSWERVRGGRERERQRDGEIETDRQTETHTQRELN